MTWQWELLAGPDTITEGPAWDGRGLFYTAIASSEIRRFDPGTNSITPVYRNTNAANGLFFDPAGNLYSCEGGGRAVVVYDTSGKRTVLADRFEGNRLNSPNDVVVESSGRVWFTDPRYGDDHSDRELDHDSVYRLTPPSSADSDWTIERMTVDTTRPNGLLLSFDERTLFVAQSNHMPSEPRQLRAYPIQEDGSLGSYRLVHDFGEYRGIDGMCFDTEENIIATCGTEGVGPGGRIAIFTRTGELIEEHQLPAGSPTNCVYGGENLDVLYVTTLTGHLYRATGTGRVGALQPPAVSPYIG